MQIETLDRVAETGELTTDMVTALYDPLFECFAALGVEGEVLGSKEAAPGVVVPDYRINIDEGLYESDGEALDDQISRCQAVHAEFVWQALYLQPKSVEAREQEQLELLPLIIECLAKVEVTLPSDPTPEEIDEGIVLARERGERCVPELLGES